MQLNHVIWDWNGTLINDAPLACRILNQLLAARGKPEITLERYQEIYEHPVRLIYERSGFDLSAESFDAVAAEWYESYLPAIETIELQPDAIQALEAFKAAGLKQALLSALPHSLLIRSVLRFGLENYFCEVSGLDNNFAESKIELAYELLSSLGAEPDSTIMIGDSSHDLETAEALGLRCLLVSRGFEHPRRLARLDVPVFSNFEELLKELQLSDPSSVG